MPLAMKLQFPVLTAAGDDCMHVKTGYSTGGDVILLCHHQAGGLKNGPASNTLDLHKSLFNRPTTFPTSYPTNVVPHLHANREAIRTLYYLTATVWLDAKFENTG